MLISSLVVANTTSVLVAQRTREFGLLRLVGASRRQILGLVMGQSLGVGVVGAGLGLGLGIVLAYVAARVVRDSTVPVGFALTGSMVVVAVVIGLAVTLIGGIVPALRAGRIAPLAALSDTRGGDDRAARWRGPTLAVVSGAALVAISLRWGGGVNDAGGRLAALGAVIAFAGVAGLSRWVVGPLMFAAGATVGPLAGPAGRLAIRNVRRQPSRTSGAASTLMVGLALVAFVATFGASVRSTVRSQFSTGTRADLYLERRGVVRVSTAELEGQLLERLRFRDRRTIEFATLSSVDGELVGPTGATAPTAAAELDRLDALVDLDVSSGAASANASSGETNVIVSDATAGSLQVGVGDEVTLRTISGTEIALTVAATYRNTAIAGQAIVDLTSTIDRSALGTFELGIVRFPGSRFRGGRARLVADVAAGFPKVRVHTPTQFGELNASVADTVLRIIGVVLVGMIGIGYLGLVATLGLATLERRRELLMLRAVGASRPQVRTMVSLEATLIGVIAAIVGLGIGVIAGSVGASAAPSDLAASVVIPWSGLGIVGVGSVLLSCVVSLGVARRAARLPPAEAGRDL